MASIYDIEPLRGGGLSESGTPRTPRYEEVIAARGLQVRGVVLRVYSTDSVDPVLEQKERVVLATIPENRRPVYVGAAQTTRTVDRGALFCDVLVYSSIRGARFSVLHRVLVTHPKSGLHTGSTWRPRATSKRIDLRDLAALSQVNPAELDGDHVVVGFLDDDVAQPYIMTAVAHPNVNRGVVRPTSTTPTAPRPLAPRETDNDSDLTKFHGAVFGVDDAGDYIVDLVRSNDGETDSQGRPPRLPTDPDTTSDLIVDEGGNLTISLRASKVATIRILDETEPDVLSKATVLRIESGRIWIAPVDGYAVRGKVEIDMNGPTARVRVGSDEEQAAITSKLEALYSQLKTFLDTATVMTALGPSSVLVGAPPTAAAPSWDSSIGSTVVTMAPNPG